MTHSKYLVVGNWKMFGTYESSATLSRHLASHIKMAESKCEVVICPPFTLLSNVAGNLAGSGIKLGAQNCAETIKAEGAFTGEVSAAMLEDVGCEYVILGHSERRTAMHETNKTVAIKAEAAHSRNLKAIICIGETLDERKSGKVYEVLAAQLRDSIPYTANEENTIIAYEPVWAIGTGESATTEQIREVHEFLRNNMKSFLPNGITEIENKIKILYGGSVKSTNAQDILAIKDVDGALVGSASLNADEFLGIISATKKLQD